MLVLEFFVGDGASTSHVGCVTEIRPALPRMRFIIADRGAVECERIKIEFVIAYRKTIFGIRKNFRNNVLILRFINGRIV